MTDPSPAIALTDPAARDPAVVGVKAAGLAAAAAAGLPVLAGGVLPLEASAAAIAAGADAMERSGAPGAYLAAMACPVPADLEARLAAPHPGEDRFVVRSSTGRDGDGRWSGAFASYLDVASEDLPTAVRGCWASAFSADALERCRAAGVDVATVRVAVVVQPFRSFDAGGTARVRDDGGVIVTAAPGGPAGVMAGRPEGADVTVGPDGRIVREPGGDRAAAGAETIAAVATLARRAAATVAADVIEWGAFAGDVSLLQIGPAAPPKAAQRGPAAPRPTEALLPPDAERLARLVTAFPGPIADELVLPWALGARAGSRSSAGFGDGTRPNPVADPASSLREARGLAADLSGGVWGTSPGAARDRAAAVFGLLLEGRVAEGVEAIVGLSEPEPAAAQRVVELVRAVGEHLARVGVLPSGVLVWRLSASELDRAIDGVRPVLRNGPGRWEPFVADVVSSRGRRVQAHPVAPGVGAGPARRIHELRAIGHPGPREVLVIPRPLPHLAPLLWHGAGLVTAGGTSGAHLFEVARSLGVPAVVGVDLDALGAAGSLVAVDGDAGVVSVLRGPLPAGGNAPEPGEVRSRAMV